MALGHSSSMDETKNVELLLLVYMQSHEKQDRLQSYWKQILQFRFYSQLLTYP